jgi:hypothetical protein
MCRCVGYYAGDLCQVPYQNCPNATRCFNGGSCTLEGGCNCPAGYRGAACETIGVEETSFPNSKAGRASVGVISSLLLAVVVVVALLLLRIRRRRVAKDQKLDPTESLQLQISSIQESPCRNII